MAFFELESRADAEAGAGSHWPRRPASPSHFADVRSLFPQAGAGIPDVASRSKVFRALCHDYEMAAGALRALEIRNHPLDVESMCEYRRVLRDLEAKLVREFRARSQRSGDCVARGAMDSRSKRA